MSNLPRGKSDAYWEGYYESAASTVAKSLRQDNAIKQRILARNPRLAYGLDAGEAEGMSSAELATRELKELGITPKNSDPVELLDAHHAGREHARAQGRGVRGVAVKSSVMEGMDASGATFMDKYLE